MSEQYSIRSLIRANELVWILALQDVVFGDESPDLLSFRTLIDLSRNGGHIIGAFDGNHLVGFLVAFLGTDSRDPHRPAMANLKLVIDRIAVHPDYRSVGLATQMALRLRDIATKQGIRLITSSFDPLDSRTAYLLVRKLGATINHYMPAYYGTEDSDRVVAEWWITHNRVEERLFGQRGQLSLTQYVEVDAPILNPSQAIPDSVQINPFTSPVEVPDKNMLLVESLSEAPSLASSNPELWLLWQQHIRDALLTLIDHGYIVTDFLYEMYENRQRAFYLLSYNGPRLSIEL